MTIEEAIEHCKEVAIENRRSALNFARGYVYDAARNCQECAAEHEQLAEWLEELKHRREADYECSECGAGIGTVKPPYCAYCGARMDGGAENG